MEQVNLVVFTLALFREVEKEIEFKRGGETISDVLWHLTRLTKAAVDRFKGRIHEVTPEPSSYSASIYVLPFAV